MLKQNLPIFMLVSKRNVSNFAGGVSTIKKSNVSALFLHNKEKKNFRVIINFTPLARSLNGFCFHNTIYTWVRYYKGKKYPLKKKKKYVRFNSSLLFCNVGSKDAVYLSATYLLKLLALMATAR